MKTKHAKIVHEGVKLFCHYFNNRKTCPKASECVFLHEDAELCKYGAQCVRINCMFKHIIIEYSADDIIDVDDEKSVVNEDNAESDLYNEEDDDDDDNEDEDEDDDDDDDDDEDADEDDDEADVKTDGLDNSKEPDSDVIEVPMEPGSVESVEFIVFLHCKDQWLSKDQVYYTQELEMFEEIERVENLWTKL